jgi:L-rhamnose-H+ transport protein
MYGLGMRYLGMSLGNSVLLGFTSAFGALVPSIYYNFHPAEGKTTFNDLLTTSWGRNRSYRRCALFNWNLYLWQGGSFKRTRVAGRKKRKKV